MIDLTKRISAAIGLSDIVLSILYLAWILGILAVPIINIGGGVLLNLGLVRDTIVASVFTNTDRLWWYFWSALGLSVWTVSGFFWMWHTAITIPRKIIGPHLLECIRTIYVLATIIPIFSSGLAIRGVAMKASLDPGAPIEIATLKIFFYSACAVSFVLLLISQKAFMRACDHNVTALEWHRWSNRRNRKYIVFFYISVLVAVVWSIYPSITTIYPLPVFFFFSLALAVWIGIISGISNLLLIIPKEYRSSFVSWSKKFFSQRKEGGDGEREVGKKPNQIQEAEQEAEQDEIEGGYVGIVQSPQIWSIIAAIVVVFTFWTAQSAPENTKKGGADQQGATLSNPRREIEAHLEGWMNERYPTGIDDLDENDKVPLVFISASGGGLRAAIWTASVLNQFSELDPKFAKHIWSASGVSGGSIGLASYFAAIRFDSDLLVSATRNCRANDRGTSDVSERTVSECLEAFFNSDSLSPILSAAFFRDPVPFGSTGNRTELLFDVWQHHWERNLIGSEFGRPLDGFAPGGIKVGPILLFNTTVVELGRRFILSNVSLKPSDFDFHFVQNDISEMNLNLIEAAGISALFPIISTAYPLYQSCEGGNSNSSEALSDWHVEKCNFRNGDDQSVLWGHLVDGGYFENLGARSTFNIFEATMRAWDNLGIKATPVPIVIQITNDPLIDQFPNSVSRSYVKDMVPSPANLSSPTTPVSTFLSTMSAHQYIELEDFIGHMGEHLDENPLLDDEGFFHVKLCSTDRGGDVPLTWYLSQTYVGDLLSARRFRDCTDPEVTIRKVILKIANL
ncbi:MAG: patatin-like phospholipase family protein [Paracoccaceae bacterium]